MSEYKGEWTADQWQQAWTIPVGKAYACDTCESMIMVCVQVIGEDSAVSIAGSRGDLELNVLRPLAIHNFVHSATLLADACGTFRVHCVDGIELNRERMAESLNQSLMLVTALVPEIGYERAAEIAKSAAVSGGLLRDAAIASGHVSAEVYDRLVDPAAMANPPGQ